MHLAVPAPKGLVAAAAVRVGPWRAASGAFAIDAGAPYPAADWLAPPVDCPIPYGCSTALVRRRHRPGRELAGGCAFRHAVPEVEPPPASVPFQDGVLPVVAGVRYIVSL